MQNLYVRILGFNITREKRSESTLRNPAPWMMGAFGTLTTSGIAVSEETALQFSAVWACVRLKSQTVAQLPVELYGRAQGGGKYIDFTHPAYKLIKQQPNHAHTPFIFDEITQSHIELYGNSYCIIYRNKSTAAPEELWPVHPNKVTVILGKDRKLYYQIQGEKDTFNADDILHIPGLGFDGIKGKSPIRVAAENIGAGIGAQTYGNTFFGNGANVGTVYEHPGKLSDEAYKRLEESSKKHTGPFNANKRQILEEGMKLSRIGLAPEEAQFLETIKAKKSDIATFYGVPQHLIGVMDGATFSNIEHQAIEYVQHTVMGMIRRREDEYNRKLLTTSEVGVKYFKYNVNGLLRGDMAARAAFYKELRRLGAINSDEIRQYEDMNAIEGGKEYTVDMSTMPLDMLRPWVQSMIDSKQQPGANTDPNNITK